MRALWIGSGLFGIAMGLVFFVMLSVMEAGTPPDQGIPTVWKAVLCTALALAGGTAFGLLIQPAVRRMSPLPRGATMATRRAAARVIRRRRLTGDPLVDETARIVARNSLRRSPWSALYFPMIVFLIGFTANAWSVLERFPWPEGILAVPWINLFGFAFFLFLLTATLPLAARERKAALAFLNTLDGAGRTGSGTEEGR